MLEYDRIYFSEGINANKTDSSCGCIICYWYFFNINFKFQSKVCDGCHDMTQKSLSPNDFAIVTVKGDIIELAFGSWLKAS